MARPLLTVRLVPATVQHLEALQRSPADFEELIGSSIPKGWPQFPEAIGATLEHLKRKELPFDDWSMHFFIAEPTGALVGSGGYAGPPQSGTVEIGYEIGPQFQGQGMGTASARALIAKALASGAVDQVIAHTLPGLNPSSRVLQSLGFQMIAERSDTEEGVVWEWSWRPQPETE